MAFYDLREFINALESRGMLKRIKTPVDCNLEITEITDRVSKMEGKKNVALLFENVKGYDMPVLMNAFGSMERLALAFGVNDIEEIPNELREILRLPYISLQNKMDLIHIIPTAKRAINFPKYVKKAPCQEVVITDNPTLDKFPILKCWPQDGGPFITLPLVFTRNPKTGKRNVGMYRLQKYDGQTTGMHWHLHKDGASNYRAYQEMGKDKIEVAVAIGTDPVITYAATAPLPRDIDEMVFAGFLRKKSVEMVKCKTVDVEVPACSEIVLEGYVNIGETRREGPFGDHTGYYSLADDYPVFHITCITHRKNPIYSATIVGKPPMEDCFLAKATERIFLPLLQQTLPEIRDINFPLEGVFHDCVMVSIKKTYPQQAKKVMHAIWHLYRKIPLFVLLSFLHILEEVLLFSLYFFHIYKNIPVYVHLHKKIPKSVHLLHLHRNHKCHKNTLDNSLYNKIPIYQRLSQSQDTYASNTSPKIQDMYCNLLH